MSNGRASPSGRHANASAYNGHAGPSVFGEGPLPPSSSGMWGAGGQFAAFPRSVDPLFGGQLQDHAAGVFLEM